MVLQLARRFTGMSEYKIAIAVIENDCKPSMEAAKAYRARGIETAILRAHSRLDVSTILSLRAFVRSHNVDIIHSHNYKSNMYAFLATRGLPTRLIATCHNWLGSSRKMKTYALLDQLLLRKFDQVVAVSEDVRKKLLKIVRKGYVPVVFNGIAVEDMMNGPSREEIRSSLGLEPGQCVIGVVGRLSEEKGHKVLFEAVKSLRSLYPEVAVLVVGEGSLGEMLRKEYASSSIIFAGYRRDVGQLYSAMDIFALPSLEEGLPMVLLEAMASRLPVVASRVGSVHLVMEDGVTGYVVAPGDRCELETSIERLVADRQKRAIMGLAGHYRVQREYSAERMAQEYRRLYSNVLSCSAATFSAHDSQA